MTRRLWISIFILPALRGLAQWLRDKDANSTGLDDATADATDRYIDELQNYLIAE